MKKFFITLAGAPINYGDKLTDEQVKLAWRCLKQDAKLGGKFFDEKFKQKETLAIAAQTGYVKEDPSGEEIFNAHIAIHSIEIEALLNSKTPEQEFADIVSEINKRNERSRLYSLAVFAALMCAMLVIKSW